MANALMMATRCGLSGPWAPDVDISETKEALTVKAELPGIDPKEVQVTLE